MPIISNASQFSCNVRARRPPIWLDDTIDSPLIAAHLFIDINLSLVAAPRIIGHISLDSWKTRDYATTLFAWTWRLDQCPNPPPPRL